MSGPAQQTTNSIVIPPGEGRRIYSPVPLAWIVENLETDDDDSLKSIVGPAVLRIKTTYEEEENSFQVNVTPSEEVEVLDQEYVPRFFKTTRPHSIFHANLLNGSAETLYYRFGTNLYRFRGEFGEEDEIIESGLSSMALPKFPDQYVVINNKVVYTNGVDRPRVISYDGSVDLLGFTQRPSTPMLDGPSQPDASDAPYYFPNSSGYSYPGRIGTPGDTLTGREGSLLAGQWYYYFQFEDRHGNLSEFSQRSESVSTKASQAQPFGGTGLTSGRKFGKGDDGDFLKTDGSELDDLTRRFLVSMSGTAPEHTVAVRIFRTPDTQHIDNVPRFLARVPGSKSFVYDDNHADSELGTPWSETAPLPTFHVMCAHQGRLIVGNLTGEPGMVRQSEPGFPGTFLKDDFIFPDAGGAAITGLVSHNGVLLAFTENNIYRISDDFMTPQPISLGVGCSAPRSIVARRDGTLMWLSRDGFYGMRELGSIVRMSSTIDKIFKSDVNLGQLNMAVAVFDTDSGEYRCALAPKGTRENRLIFCFDGKYWRRQTLGIHIADMCVSSNSFRHTFAIGRDPREKSVAVRVDKGSSFVTGQDGKPKSIDYDITTSVSMSRIFVLNRQTSDWFGPPRRIRYRSNWIYSSDFGLTPTNVRTLYVGMKDAFDGFATVKIFKNGSWDPVHVMKDLRTIGVDDDSNIVRDIASDAKFDESKFHLPRLYWRQVPVNLQNVNSWAFEIELFGFPAPFRGADLEKSYASDGSAYSENLKKDTGSLKTLFNQGLDSVNEFIQSFDSISETGQPWPELGRLRIAAFAFDASIATKGNAKGRVARRTDR